MSTETTKTTDEKPKSRTVCVEDPALTMVEPDTMTPHQYFERLFTESTLVPEKRLMLAVLEDAIASFQRNFINARNNQGQLDDCDVESWLESDDMSWPFSFASICQALDMEPEYLRRGLLNWRARTAEAGIKGQVYRFPFRRVTASMQSASVGSCVKRAETDASP